MTRGYMGSTADGGIDDADRSSTPSSPLTPFGEACELLRECVEGTVEDCTKWNRRTRAFLERFARSESGQGVKCHHGWRGSPIDHSIVTPCPACGAKSLFIGEGGHLTCARVPNDFSNGCDSPSVESTVNALKRELADAKDDVKRLHAEKMELVEKYELPARSASAARLTPKLVKQIEANGCIVAALAMVTGKLYDDVRADHIFSSLDNESSGASFREAEEYLYRNGFAWQEVFRYGPPGNTCKAVWPPEPWADVHLCEVRTVQNHAVVLLRDGSVLDPLSDDPKCLRDYAEVFSVRAVYPVDRRNET